MQPPKAPINWKQIASDFVGGMLFFFALIVIILTLILGLG